MVLKIHVDSHPILRREGDDLHMVVPVTVGEAYRGAKINVPTLEGEVSLTIPKGARSGAKLRLRGKGVQKAEGSGDLIVTLQIRLPEVESEAADSAVEALDALYGDGPRSGLRI